MGELWVNESKAVYGGYPKKTDSCAIVEVNGRTYVLPKTEVVAGILGGIISQPVGLTATIQDFEVLILSDHLQDLGGKRIDPDATYPSRKELFAKGYSNKTYKDRIALHKELITPSGTKSRG